jgi:hypothetical protein
MKNTKELNIFITIVLILICSYIICSLMTKKENFIGEAPKELSELQTKSECEFTPDKSNTIFNTQQSCKDRCMHQSDRESWGGDLCTSVSCEKICNKCKNKPNCRWLDTNQDEVPDISDIVLKKNNIGNPVIYWTEPHCPKDSPILYYIIVIESDKFTDKVRVNTFKPPEKKISNEYEIFNLVPIDNKNTIYDISLFSRNNNGYSDQSNKIRFISIKSDEFTEQQSTTGDIIEDKSKNVYTNREKQAIYRLIENKLS